MILLDKILIILLLISFLMGWLKGFLRATLGPISFFLCLLFAIIYYDVNDNIIVSSLIVVLGSVGLSIGLSILQEIGLATVNKEFRGKVSLPSRILGSSINLVWQGNILAGLLILMAALPFNGSKLEEIQKQTYQSNFIRYYYKHVVLQYPRGLAILKTLEDLQDPQKQAVLRRTKEFSAFYNDPKTQEYFRDPEVSKAFADQNLIEVMKAPKTKTFMANDDSMVMLSKAIQRVYFENLKQLTSPLPAPSPAQSPTP